MVKLIEATVEKFPGVKVWVAEDGSLYPMVRIGEVAQTPERKVALDKFMPHQTMPLIEDAERRAKEKDKAAL